MTDDAAGLEAVFGGPSDDAFGSAVFRREATPETDMEQAAQEVYRDFLGESWQRGGAGTWMATWRTLAERTVADGAGRPVLDMLTGLPGPEASSSADVLLNGGSDPEAARRALAAAFDSPTVAELRIHAIGDGAALSGLLLAGRDGQRGEAVFVVFLMD